MVLAAYVPLRCEVNKIDPLIIVGTLRYGSRNLLKWFPLGIFERGLFQEVRKAVGSPAHVGA